MTITLDIRPEIQAELARRAAAQGRAVEAYVAGLLEEAAKLPPTTWPRLPAKDQAIDQDRVEAIERLVTFGRRHGLSLGDVTIRQLRDEARP